MSITSDHIQITSSSPTGATIATDYISSNGEHIQEVKLNVGGANSDALLSDTNSIPVRNSTVSYLRVSGNTSGTAAVAVSISGGGSFNVANVTIGGGTLNRVTEGVSADLRYIKKGITLGVVTIGQTNKVAVTGDVKLAPSTNNIGDVDVLTVAIPSVMKHGKVNVKSGSAATLGTAGYAPSFSSGIRITNMNTATTVLVGSSGGVSSGGANLANYGFPLGPQDSMFLEMSSGANVYLIARDGTTADVRYIGT